MENKDFDQKDKRFDWEKDAYGYKPNRTGRILAGLLVLIVGVALLGNQLHFLDLPGWLFSWKVLVILIGLFIGIKESFRNVTWLIFVMIGSIFLLEDIYPEFSVRSYFWPILIISIGLWLILSSGRSRHSCNRYWKKKMKINSESFSREDMIDSVTVFGGVKKNIISKKFQGGEIVTIFAGAEYNLTQADFEGRIELEVVQIFGGTTLIIPPHWTVKSEIEAVFGGIEDKRPLTPADFDENKVLILKGTTIFGGLSLKSY